jgi:hypothetical protein
MKSSVLAIHQEFNKHSQAPPSVRDCQLMSKDLKAKLPLKFNLVGADVLAFGISSWLLSPLS